MPEVQGNEVVLDAYSVIGTIGIIAAKKARKVISIEFHEEDATEFILSLDKRAKIHTVFMDPPRKGST